MLKVISSKMKNLYSFEEAFDQELPKLADKECAECGGAFRNYIMPRIRPLIHELVQSNPDWTHAEVIKAAADSPVFQTYKAEYYTNRIPEAKFDTPHQTIEFANTGVPVARFDSE